MLATTIPSPLSPYCDQTWSALMLATPHSTELISCSVVPWVTLGTSIATGAYRPSTSVWVARFWASASEPLSMRIAFVPQNEVYFTCCASSSARIFAWLSAAVLRSAAATAVPRSFQSVILLAAVRSAFAPNRTQ